MEPPEREQEDCLFCNPKFQDQFLSEMKYMRKILTRYIIYSAFAGGLLVGLGILSLQHISTAASLVGFVAQILGIVTGGFH